MTAALQMPDELAPGDLLSVIRHQADNAPRSLQKAIGPSGVGTPCDRRLALDLLGATTHNTGQDKWASTVGTAVHAWLADAFTADNAQLAGQGLAPRWLVEQRVTIRTGLSGSCDLYDLWTHTAVDWKNLGVGSLRKYRTANDPGQQYRWQLHLYGRGWANAGLPVRTVMLVGLPRSGQLRDTWTWDEPYDPTVAQQALDRMDGLLVAMNAADVDTHPERMRALSRDTSMCDWCPFYTPDQAVSPIDGCNGPLEDPDFRAPARQAVAGLF